jgi:glycerate kinase
MDARLRRATIVAATDVESPLTGPTGASAVFGPQKGATSEDVVVLDRALAHLASVCHRDLGVDLSREPGAGAAGGLAFGLLAFCGARIRPGVDVVIDALELRDRVARADVVVTGEGALDRTSVGGKVLGGLRSLAEMLRTPLVAIVGRADVRPAGVHVVSLVEEVGPERSMAEARRSLELVTEHLAEEAGELVGA